MRAGPRRGFAIETPEVEIADGVASDMRRMLSELGLTTAEVRTDGTMVHLEGPAWVVELVARAFERHAKTLGIDLRIVDKPPQGPVGEA